MRLRIQAASLRLSRPNRHCARRSGRGSRNAASRLTTLPEWAAARRLKCNPDAAQLPVRRAALAAGKHVFMALPRLSAAKCFLHLDPERLRGRLAKAATIAGAA